MTCNKPKPYSQLKLLRIDIGRRINEERIKKKVSLEHLASRVNLKPSGLERIEKGKGKFNLPVLAHIARGLRVRLSTLIRAGMGEDKN